jgi:hypothetical protein
MLAGFHAHRWDAPQAASEFSDYVQERWKGQSFLHEGKQLEQLGFSHELYGDELAFTDAGANHGK